MVDNGLGGNVRGLFACKTYLVTGYSCCQDCDPVGGKGL